MLIETLTGMIGDNTSHCSITVNEYVDRSMFLAHICPMHSSTTTLDVSSCVFSTEVFQILYKFLICFKPISLPHTCNEPDPSLSPARLQVDKQRVGVLVGSGIGGFQVFYDGAVACLTKGPKKISPYFIPYAITNMGSALLAMEFGFMGPNYSISTACATANYCFAAAANHIRRWAMVVCVGCRGS